MAATGNVGTDFRGVTYKVECEYSGDILRLCSDSIHRFLRYGTNDRDNLIDLYLS